MAIVSDIEIRLRADIARLQQDMDSARRAVGGAMDGITKAAGMASAALGAIGVALSVGAFAQWIKGAIDATDAVSDISQRTGIAIKDIAALQLAFQKGGMEAGDMEGSMVRLSRAIADGNEALGRIGIKTKATTGEFRSSKDVLYDVADAFSQLEDGTQKTALAVEVFGKSGAAMIPLLNEGSEGLRKMDEMATKLGITFDEKTVEAAGDFNDTLDFLALAGQGVARQLSAQLLPALNDVAGSFLNFITTGDKVRKAADIIGGGFKILYTIGVGIAEIFNTVGSTLGAAAAQLVAILQGDFKTAANIGKAWFSDMKDSWASSAKAITDAWNGAGDGVLEALVKTQHGSTSVTEQVGKDAKRQVDAYQGLIDAAQARLFETGREAAGLDKLTDSQKMALQLDQDLANGKVKLTAEQEAYYRMLIEAIAVNEQQVAVNKEVEESNKRAQKGAEDFAKLQKTLNDEAVKTIKAAEEEAEKNEELARTYGMTEGAIAALEVARLKEQLAQRATLGLTLDEIEHLEKLIAAKERSAKAIANVDDLKKQRELWGSIEKTAHDTFVSILDGGKDVAARLKDTFKNIFFDWLYQQTLKKWIIQLSPQATGGGGGLSDIMSFFSGTGKAFSSGSTEAGGGFMSSVSGLVSAGKYLYQGFSQGFASIFGGGAAGGAAAGAGGAMSGMSAGLMSNPVGWVIAGMMANDKFFKQGWNIDGQTGDIAGSLLKSSLKGNPLGGAWALQTVGINAANNVLKKLGLNDRMASLLSGASLWARAFGRRKPTIEEQGIQGTLSAGGFSGEAFANILEKGGWFRSDKRYTKTAALDAETDKTFDDTMAAMVASVRGFGTAIGAQTSAIDGYSKQIKLTLTDDEAKNQELITQVFGSVADELSTLLLPNIAQFQKGTETASATLQRLALDFQLVDEILTAMGTNSQQAFGAVGVATIAARERLIEFAGGLDALASQVDFFNNNFLTEAERIAPVQKQVAEQMAALGYAGVTTTDQFKAAVQGLIASGALATESGAKTYTALLALAPAFKAVADYATEAQLAAQLAAEQLAAAKAAAALQAIADQAALLTAAVDSALVGVQRAVAAQKDAAAQEFADLMNRIGASIDGANGRVTSLQSLINSLAGARGIGADPAVAREAAQAQLAGVVAAAKSSGVLPTAEVMERVVRSLSADTEGQFATLVDFQRDQLRTANNIEELAGITDTQLTTEQRTLQALLDQKAAAERAYSAETERLDAMIAKAQQQVDIANGTYTVVQTIPAAFANLAAAIAALKTNPVAAAPAATQSAYQQYLGRDASQAETEYWKEQAAKGVNVTDMVKNSDEARIQALYQKYLGRTGEAAGVDAWEAALKAGQTWQQIEQGFMTSPEALGRIYNPQQSGTMNAGAALSAAVDNLGARMAGMEAAMNQTASSTQQMASQIDRVTNNGSAMLVEAA